MITWRTNFWNALSTQFRYLLYVIILLMVTIVNLIVTQMSVNQSIIS